MAITKKMQIFYGTAVLLVAAATGIAILFIVGILSPDDELHKYNDLLLSKTDINCHPEFNETKIQYIIGYGSLINTKSKNRTDQDTGPNIPVRIDGFKRFWNARGTSRSKTTTYLGIVPDMESHFNGVIYKILNSNISKTMGSYDKREGMYCRVQVPYDQVNVLANNSDLPVSQGNESLKSVEIDKNSEIWIYLTQFEHSHLPSPDYPIVQSYVDVFLTGCLEQQEKYNLLDYSKDCVETTSGWSSNWVNDRLYPRRPFIYQSKASQIDKLLHKYIPYFYNQITLE